ncbi:hypothetical protein [Sphingomonas sp. M1-B02]|uniref:hypothetical protein n=1 Tax=Sphingomonas sp. M1-B02 TaxID=3114300 RepID=UPI00223F27C9|nr:hypothetical protein [Sphingomonas sp. S6-11]UZK66771.1 hypothetical protein OKW87_02735 [Sphingomonas sp. S6-11]
MRLRLILSLALFAGSSCARLSRPELQPASPVTAIGSEEVLPSPPVEMGEVLEPMVPTPVPPRRPAEAGPNWSARAPASAPRTRSQSGRLAAVAAPGDGVVACDVVNDDVPEAECRDYERQKARLAPGLMSFDPPTTMLVGMSYELTLSVGLAANAEAVRAVVRQEGRRLEERAIPVGKYMTASLSGGAFQIESTGQEGPARTLGADRSDVWQWRVTPLAKGKQRLLLTVSVEAMGPGGARSRFALVTRPIEIAVEVSPADAQKAKADDREKRLKQGTSMLNLLRDWLMALAAVIAAAGGVWLGIRRFGREKPAGETKGASASAPSPSSARGA